MLSVTNKPLMLSVFMLNIVMLSVIMLSVVMLNVVIRSVVMLNVVMRNVVAPSPPLFGAKSFYQLAFSSTQNCLFEDKEARLRERIIRNS
jgi:hypothetical protein